MVSAIDSTVSELPTDVQVEVRDELVGYVVNAAEHLRNQ
jgi:hypothetical protein